MDGLGGRLREGGGAREGGGEQDEAAVHAAFSFGWRGQD
jgi:hypothetical protein